MGLYPKNLSLVTLSLYETFNIANTCILTVLYRRHGKIRSFSLMKFFMEILLQCIGHQCLLPKNSRENFHSKLKNCENCKCLAQRIFPRLRYLYRGY